MGVIILHDDVIYDYRMSWHLSVFLSSILLFQELLFKQAFKQVL